MSIWKNWRTPIAMFAVSGMLVAAAVSMIITAGDTNEAADAGVQLGALSQAAAGVELAWFQAMSADALAATGQAPDESQGFYDGAINLYNGNKAVLQAAGVAEIDQALAASDQGLAVMSQAFTGTRALAESGNVAAATANHLDATVALYGNVEPAVKGLALVAQAADAELESRLNSGAANLRLLSGLSLAVAALGAIFAGWTAAMIYRKEDDEAGSVATEQPTSWERAA
jgi:hypothetical protein